MMALMFENIIPYNISKLKVFDMRRINILYLRKDQQLSIHM